MAAERSIADDTISIIYKTYTEVLNVGMRTELRFGSDPKEGDGAAILLNNGRSRLN